MAFLAFLLKSKSLNSSDARVFTGNEAADMDSTVSAMALAYFYEITQNGNNLPIVNIPRREFRLRTDIARAFIDAFGNDATRATDALTFADEVDLNTFDKVELVLSDHNALAKSHASLQHAKVVGIVDHHADQGLFKDAPLRIIDLECGSATSHVVLLFEKHAQAKIALEKDPHLANLLLAPILVDTIGLKPEHGRCFPVDAEAADHLSQIIKPTDKHAYFDSTFTKLQNAKFDVSALSSDDLLRKDYKQIAVNGHEIGLSSVTWHFAGWSESETKRGLDIGQEIVEFARANNLSSEIVMTAYEYSTPRGFAREMAIAVRPDSASLLSGLESDARMLMKPISVGQLSRHAVEDKDGTVWTLAVFEINPAFSRKKVLPIVQEIATSKL